jgi:hypothetical protein
VSSDLWNGSAVLLPHQQVMLARGAEDKKQPCRIWVFSDQIAMSVSHVRFPPYSDRKAAIAGGRLRAKSGHHDRRRKRTFATAGYWPIYELVFG